MSATSDYAAARAFLKPHLPAYVTYTVRSRAGFDAIRHDETETLTIRTSDGKVVKGKRPSTNVETGDGAGKGDEAISHGPFDVACYASTSARLTTFEGRSLEAISLAGTCHSDKGDKADKGDKSDDSDTDFNTLYVDPQSHEPVAAVGASDSDKVSVRLDQRYTKVQGYVMPASFHIHVKGSGLMFWLDVLADQAFSDYRFGDTIP